MSDEARDGVNGGNGKGPPREVGTPGGAPWYLYSIQLEEGPTKVLTFMSPDEMHALGGLPGRAVVGRLQDPDGELEAGNFLRNLAFLEALHIAIVAHLPTTRAWIDGARKQGAGRMYVSFARGASEGKIIAEDLAGSFDVQNGDIVENSYRPEEQFDVFTERGLIVMGEDLRKKLIEVVNSGFPPG
jgi:hypothetical protein